MKSIFSRPNYRHKLTEQTINEIKTNLSKKAKKMTDEELREIALRMVEKGYSWDKIRYCDDLYDATQEELDKCFDYVQEVKRVGTDNFEI